MDDSARPDSGTEPSKEYCEKDYKYLVAISYAGEVEGTAARLDRGLVELLGGDADRVFFDQRSLGCRLPAARVKPVLTDVFRNALLFVRLWSSNYDRSEYIELENLLSSHTLVDEPDRAYTIRVANGEPVRPITFNASLVGAWRKPLWEVTSEIVKLLDSLLGIDFAASRRRDRAFVKWDPPAYHSRFAEKLTEPCSFDCHQALAACCEAGELYCLVAQLAARLTSLAFMAQTASLANLKPDVSDPTSRFNANDGLNRECNQLLDVFLARYEHLDDMIRVRGKTEDESSKGSMFRKGPEDSCSEKAERLRDFIRLHLGFKRADSFAESVLRWADVELYRRLDPYKLHEDANTLLSWSKQIANQIATFSAGHTYLPSMEKFGKEPKLAAARYATQTTTNLVPLV